MQLLSKNEFVLSLLTAEADRWLWSPVWENTECLCGVNMVQRETHLKSWGSFGFSEEPQWRPHWRQDLFFFLFKSIIVFPRECEIHACEWSQRALQRALTLGIACGVCQRGRITTKGRWSSQTSTPELPQTLKPLPTPRLTLKREIKRLGKARRSPLWNTTPAVQNWSSVTSVVVKRLRLHTPWAGGPGFKP